MRAWLGTVAMICLTGCAGGADVVVVPVRLERSVVDANLVQSYELWILHQVGRDDTPVRCEELLDRTLTPASPNIIVIKRIAGAFDDAAVPITGLPAGEQNRIFYVDMFDAPDQVGTRVGAGCAPSVSIVGGKSVTVEIAVDIH